jgi:hypothetical protein
MPFNAHNQSCVLNALTYLTNNNEIRPYIIELGFPLYKDSSSPDLLWLVLRHFLPRKEELPLKLISSLLNNTELNEIHVDVMHKLKIENNKQYQEVISHFPELVFEAPKNLINISCSI